MLYKSDNIQVYYLNNNSQKPLCFKFIGKFTETASNDSSLIWEKTFSKGTKDQTYCLIWDCTEMTGFEAKAKNSWIKTMKSLENKIESVTVISDNTLIRGASRLMSKVFSFEIKILRSSEQISSVSP